MRGRSYNSSIITNGAGPTGAEGGEPWRLPDLVTGLPWNGYMKHPRHHPQHRKASKGLSKTGLVRRVTGVVVFSRPLVLFIIGVVFGISLVMCVGTLGVTDRRGQGAVRALSDTGYPGIGPPCANGEGTLKTGGRVPMDDNSQATDAEQAGRNAVRRDAAPIASPLASPGRSKPERHRDRELLFVGVMTTGHFLTTRALEIARSWARAVPGKVVFFVGEDSEAPIPPELTEPPLSVVRLPGVSDRTYPPQKKSFFMLRYMALHYGDRFEWFMRADDDVYVRGDRLEVLLRWHCLMAFEWFMRADDDVYVRGDRLEVLLRSLNSSRPLFIGQTGLGNQAEYGQLSLGESDNYCMGGTGMILSRSTLASIRSHIKTCLHSLFTGHEDVEVGRCIRRYAGVSCTWAYEMQRIFYNHQNGSVAFSEDLDRVDIQHAVTVHPLKQSHLMRRLHLHFRNIKLFDLRFRLLQLRRDHYASDFRESVPDDGSSNDMIAKFTDPTLLKSVPSSRANIIPWEYISPTLVYCSDGVTCPRHNTETVQKNANNYIVSQILDLMNRHARQRGRILEFTEILYAYRRLDPLHGVDYIMDLLLLYKKFKGKRISVPVRRHAYLQQVFGDMELSDPQQLELSAAIGLSQGLRSEPDNRLPSNGFPIVHIILPLSGRLPTFQRFLTHFEQTCLSQSPYYPTVSAGDADADVRERRRKRTPTNSQRGSVDCGRVSLLVVYFEEAGGPNQNQGAKSDTNGLNTDDNLGQPNSSAYLHTIQELLASLQTRYPGLSADVLPLEGSFSRGRAMMAGAGRKAPSDLLFLTDVDMLFKPAFFAKARLNTHPIRSIYFPIVFSEYDPGFATKHLLRPADMTTGTALNEVGGGDDTGGDPVKIESPDEKDVELIKDESLDISDKMVERLLANAAETAEWPGGHFDDYANERGYFRHFGYGLVVIHQRDLMAAGGFATSIRGWGLEDVDMFEKCLKSPANFTIFRAPDPDLVHVYHPVMCDAKALPSAQLKMCLGSRAATFAGQVTLARALKDSMGPGGGG